MIFTTSSHGLLPSDPDAKDWFDGRKFGQQVGVKVTVKRNVKFHRKFFAMLRVAYENHDWPTIETQYGPARCTAEKFREYVIVRAGHYEMVALPNGTVRAVPKSISFGKMDEDTFSDLYSGVLDVILAEFLTNWTNGDMENAVNQMMEFS